jgi:hypothetical protein
MINNAGNVPDCQKFASNSALSIAFVIVNYHEGRRGPRESSSFIASNPSSRPHVTLGCRKTFVNDKMLMPSGNRLSRRKEKAHTRSTKDFGSSVALSDEEDIRSATFSA